ncbi:hypothetical protein RJ640_029140, partial [Escallonia rubra]
MAPNPRVAKAFRAMKVLGVAEEKVKPVLKNLLKLYEKNWALIEEENYRALADAIFDTEDAETAAHKKNTEEEKTEGDTQVHDEPERPLKRLRLRHQEGQVSGSSPSVGATPSKRAKVGDAELLETHPEHQSRDILRSPQPDFEDERTEIQPLTRNKGKEPVSPKSFAVQGSCDKSQPAAADRIQPDLGKRTQSNSVSSPMQLRDRGKEPILPQIDSREKRITSERASLSLRFKEPKVEPGIVLLPKKKAPNTLALIRPKDEPVTDDISQFEVPIAVIHPEALPNGGSSVGNGSIVESDGPEPVASQSEDGQDEPDGIPGLSSEIRPSSELAFIPDESTSKLEIASLGEVKISLSCDSALKRPDFHMPSLDELLKSVEDRCLRSYKILDPNFSLMKVMKDMCECFLELGTDSSNEPQKTINVTPPIDLLKKHCAVDAVGTSGLASSPLNGAINIQCDAEVALPQIPRLPPPCSSMDDLAKPDKTSGRDDCHTEKDTEQNGGDHTNSSSLVVVEQRQFTADDIRSLHDVYDIARGQERMTISLVNEVNDDIPPSFHYIPKNVVFQNAYVNFSLARIVDDSCCPTCFGDCLSLSTPCACAHETGGEFAYTSEGLVKEELLEECISMNRDPEKHCQCYCKECPLERSKNEDILEPCKGHLVRKFIKECWWKCGCNKQCGNRVVQRGINRNLQVFMTPGGKGWGLRTLEELPKGAFVCEYVGEVLTNAELYDRVSHSSSKDKHAYPVLLDADWSSEGVLKDEEALCLDATFYGNVGRFINHRCFDSNMVEIPVEVETPDHHYYHLAFFTTRKVEALEELTWDYGIDFDDHEHPVKAFQCKCGSKFCRNIKRSS